MIAENKKSSIEELNDQIEKTSIQNAARQRMAMLFDEGSFIETNVFAISANANSVITGYGTVEGLTVYAFSQDREVLSGAVTQSHVQKVNKLYEMAEKTGCPIVGIYDSLGGKIDENFQTLSAYGSVIGNASRLSGVVPQISVVLGVCSSSAAIHAVSADVVIMEKDAELFMNSAFVLKARNEDALGVGTAESAMLAGTVAMVAQSEEEAFSQVKKVLKFLPENNLSAPPFCEFDDPNLISLNTICDNIEKDYDIYSVINSVADNESFIELYKSYGTGAVTGFATVMGQAVGIVATNKKQSQTISKDECIKIARFIRFCDSYSIAVITFVDTKGFEVTSAQEAAGAVKQASMLAFSYAEATTAKVAVILGEAIGPCYIALAGKSAGTDFTFAWPCAVISSILPKTAAEVLYGNEFDETNSIKVNDEEKIHRYIDENASAFKAAQGCFIDDVIVPDNTRNEIIKALEVLTGKRQVNLPKKHGNIQI